MLERNGTIFHTDLKIKISETTKRITEKNTLFNPYRPSPEERKQEKLSSEHCTIPHCPFFFLKLVVSQKGSADIDLTYVALQRSTAQ